MKLSLLERITLLNMLPAKGTITTMRLVSELRKSLPPSAQEIEDWEIREMDGKIVWNSEKVDEVDFPMDRPTINLIASLLETLDNTGDGELTEAHVSLWDKFVEHTS